ncbi:Protein trichome birefringence-like 16 [Orobanche hederae]
MKGGIQGPRLSQVSLTLIGLVCVTVLAFAWTKTTMLTSFVPSQSRFLQLDLDKAGPGNTLGEGNVDSPGSSEISERENTEIDINKEDTPASIMERTVTEEVSQRKNKSKQAEIVPENFLTIESPVRIEQTRNLSATTGKEESPSILERTGYDEHPRGKIKSKQAEIVPEKSVKTEQSRNLSAITGKKDCNYAKGKWVFDYGRPLYSGFDCKQWLSSMWACRLTQRTDFEYEKLRWEPKYCKMEEFTGSKFLHRMQHRTLAFVGDSLGRQQFQSLMCMVTGGQERPDVLNVGYEYGLVKARGAVRPDGWAYRFPSTNTTILYYWSASLCDLEPINITNPSTDIAMHLDRPPSFLRRFIHKFHVLVLNTGHHWNRGKLNANRWVMYVGGVPNTNRKIADVVGAKNFTMHSIVKWVDSQLPLYPGLTAFLRSISPRHFFNGDWNTGGTCDNTTPLSGGKEVVKDDSSDPFAAGAVRGTDVRLLDITALSELRDEGHISRYSIKATPGMQDCLHWCLPGVPDTWNEILFAQI